MRFSCLKCGNCCRDKKTVVTLTHKDIIRIAEFLGFDERRLVKDVLVFYQVDESLKKLLAFPSVETFKGEAIIGLRKREDGSCIFLQGNLCSIYPARPMTCRTFPFTFSVKDGWLKYGVATKAKELCPGLNEGEEVDENQLAELGLSAVTELEEYSKITLLWKKLVEKNVPAIPELLIRLILQGKNRKKLALTH